MVITGGSYMLGDHFLELKVNLVCILAGYNPSSILLY